ncbi:serine/threonine-protein phosphatase [Desulfofundulus thermocisternus]|uniref:serine/threonine-protein phosphatase n=1 Tax=Desulfofundulus thermocisternus TaxID=42471 RepID=UPI0019DC5ACB|nr:serine/threonine-protein phosphatase [Desulfofundulus thermocisternus]MBE3585329.1 SpoIIE family protein phosphatase [Thermoanaerobacter sp.]MCS5695114.1 serine/threonine-protein phosphatase [Desulfofundulus thermocisternus]
MKIFLDIGRAQLNKAGEELCGDSIEVVRTRSSTIVVLSDGLGSGVKANILSSLTTKTAATMLRMGGEIEEVIETLVQTLPTCRVRKLAYSTFSILQVMAGGRAYLVEYDNPRAFLGHRDRLREIGRIRRVINDKEITEAFFDFREGDWLVLISDGVVHAGTGGVLNRGWGWDGVRTFLLELAAKNLDAAAWARELIQRCHQLYAGRPGDDTSVVVMKALAPRKVTVMIGPPMDRSADALVVEKLVRSPGVKVVCGGTTASIVARVLGREIEVDLSTRSDRVPPVGIIAGIDLVTEGTLTVLYALEHLRQGVPLEDLQKARDGASRLAATLLGADLIHFIVGLAVNPAGDCTYKHRTIEQLIRLLRKKGKEVTAEYR